MKAKDSDHRNPGEFSAPEWFVTLDAGAVDKATDDAFVAWLKRNADNQAGYERCEAIPALSQHLRNDEDLEWAFRECEELAAGQRVAQGGRSGVRRFAGRGFGLGLAGLAVLAIAVALTRVGDDNTEDAGIAIDSADIRASEDASAAATEPMADTPAPASETSGLGPVKVEIPARSTLTDVPVSERAEFEATREDFLVFQRRQKLTELKARRAELSQIYTENHPEMVRLQSEIEKLERQQAAEAASSHSAQEAPVHPAASPPTEARPILELIDLISEGRTDANSAGGANSTGDVSTDAVSDVPKVQFE